MKSRIFFTLKIVLLTFVFFAVFSTLAAMGIFLHYSRNLPRIITIEDYKPRGVTEVFDDNSVKIGEFYRENRIVVPYSKIPTSLIQAFVSSEDDRFFQHKGLDFQGIIRAMIVNFRTGRMAQGGSTITQQVAKSLLLTSEKKISRKVKEAILASKLESHLSKEQILYLYLNQIYLGHGAYGVQAAAKTYFNKDVSELDLAESAMIAGLPQAPSKYSPFANPDKAKERQIYVLTRMTEEGYITAADAEKAANKRLKLYKIKDYNQQFAPHFTEMVRRYLVSKYGNDRVLDEALKVYTTLNYEMQKNAYKAVRDGLKELDKRQGFKGPLAQLESDKKIEEELNIIHKEICESSRDFIYFPEPGYKFKLSARNFGIKDEDPNSAPVDINTIPTPVKKGEMYRAVVLSVNDKQKEVKIGVGKENGTIPFKYMAWAGKRPLSLNEYVPQLKNPSEVLKRGDVIYVTQVEGDIFALEQEPDVEGALLSFDYKTGFIRAMVGGYDYGRSEFNRTYQARRQAGSTFKPFLYTAALDKGYTPSTIIVDAPIVYGEDDEEGKWKPENYDQEFRGDITLREAFIFSRNAPAVKVLSEIGIPYAIEYAKKMGIRSQMQPDLSLALGSAAVSLWEMSKGYAVIAAGGKRVIPIFIKKIEDRYSKLLEETDMQKPIDWVVASIEEKEDAKKIREKEKEDKKEEKKETANNSDDSSEEGELPPPVNTTTVVPLVQPVNTGETAWEEVVSSQTAYVMTHLMKEVCQMGTGAARLRSSSKPVAGKTGTTNDYNNAWFMGFSTKLITGVWVGFDDNTKTLGHGETGAKAAIPIWQSYMYSTFNDTTDDDFMQPQGIKVVKIDAETGKIASKKSRKVVYEVFKEGTEPTEADERKKIEDADDAQFFREDN